MVLRVTDAYTNEMLQMRYPQIKGVEIVIFQEK